MFSKIRQRLLLVCLSCFCISTTMAQEVLTLDACRRMAIAQNKTLSISHLQREQADYTHRAARANYLPKIDFVGGYIHSGKEASILNDDQKAALTGVGGKLQGAIGDIIAAHPDLAPLVGQYADQIAAVSTGLTGVGQSIVDAFRTDTRNMTAAAVMLTQPLYMGGKIKAYDRITKLSADIAGEAERAEIQSLLLDVDKAYWQVVSLVAKRKLALSYRDMLLHLDKDVLIMIDEGVATKASELTVNVKLNEAEMALTKVENGLALSRMLLCQLCGLPLESNPTLADESLDNIATDIIETTPDIAKAYEERPEIQQLALASDIYKEKVKIVRSDYMPQLALIGGYMLSNPNPYNGFEKKFRGNWSVGITLKMPIWHWGEGRNKIKAAQAEAQIAALKTEEAKEKIALQVTQSSFTVNEANRQLELSLNNLGKANENLRVAGVGFQEGVIATSDLLAAQTAWLQAESEKIDAQINVKLAYAAYNKALGILK